MKWDGLLFPSTSHFWEQSAVWLFNNLLSCWQKRKLMQPLSQYHDMTIPYNIYLTESFLFIIKQSSDQLYHRKNRNSLHSFVCPRESSHLQINLLLNGVSLTNPSIFVSLYHLKGHEVSASIISIKIDICTTCTG